MQKGAARQARGFVNDYDYINMNMRGEIATIDEGKTKSELLKSGDKEQDGFDNVVEKKEQFSFDASDLSEEQPF